MFGKKQGDLSLPRQKEHNDMYLAIEKMKEKGRVKAVRMSMRSL